MEATLERNENEEAAAELTRLLNKFRITTPSPELNNEPARPPSLEQKLLEMLVEEVRGMRREMERIARTQEYQKHFCTELLEILKAENAKTSDRDEEIRQELGTLRQDVQAVRRVQEDTLRNTPNLRYLAVSLNNWHQESQSSMAKIQEKIDQIGNSKEEVKTVPNDNDQKKKKAEPKTIVDEIVGTWRLTLQENMQKYLAKPNSFGITPENYCCDVRFDVSEDQLLWCTSQNPLMFCEQLGVKNDYQECYKRKNRFHLVYKKNGKELERMCRHVKDGKLVITATMSGGTACKRVYARVG